MNYTLLATSCTVIALAGGLPRAQPSSTASDPVVAWSVAASAAAAASGMAPLRTPITFALLHLAMYDAVHAIIGGRDLYGAHPPVTPSASPHAAAIEAGYRIVAAEFPSQQKALDTVYRGLMTALPEGMAKRNGTEVGAAVAKQLLALRATDGRNAVVPFTHGTGAGAWRPTPPELLATTTAFLANVTPFTMDSPAQFRPAGPPTLMSQRWANDYNEVRALGVDRGSTRTAAQTATAIFWEPQAGTVWPAAIRRLASEQGLDLGASAHFQAVAFAAFADALIACWDAKFAYAFWRPVTAIQHGETDGNPQTQPDPTWAPLAVTPDFPEYPSGHACVTAAVAHTIEDYFPNGILIPARNVVSGEERIYRKAGDAVDEVIEARMLIGVHFRFANEDGADIGRKIARQIRTRWFKPRDASSSTPVEPRQ